MFLLLSIIFWLDFGSVPTMWDCCLNVIISYHCTFLTWYIHFNKSQYGSHAKQTTVVSNFRLLSKVYILYTCTYDCLNSNCGELDCTQNAL
jgi:hypothetical protein